MIPSEQKNLQLEAEAQERMARVASLYLGGKSMREVARIMDLSVMTIARDLARAREEWKTRAADTYGDTLPVALARCQFIWNQAYLGWEASLKHSTSQDTETGESAKGPYTKKRKGRKSQAGNPVFLARMESALRLDCQLRGLLDDQASKTNDEAAEVVEVVITTREENEEFKTLSLEEFKRRTAKPTGQVG
ncbi:MAG: ECF-type sigma factor [Planctomycetaceae bacterium]